MRVGEERAKGYYKEDLKEVFRRYITRADLDAKNADLAGWKAEKTPAQAASEGTEKVKPGQSEGNQ